MSPTETAPGAAALRARVFAAFALHAASVGVYTARVPDIQVRLGLDDAALGALLTTGAVGALAIYLVAGRIARYFGPPTVTLWGLVGTNITAFLIASTGVLPLVFVLSFVQGALFTLANIAINVEADRIEAATGRRVMNTCHGVWSLSMLGVSALSAGLRALRVAPSLHLMVNGAVVIVLLLIVVGRMQPQPPRGAGGVGNSRFAWPTAATLAIVAFGIGGMLLENAGSGWSIIFLRDTFDASRLVEGLALPIYILAMTATRLSADRRLDRYSAAAVGRTQLAMAIAGVVVLVISPWPGVALLGFALIGGGVGPIFPMMVSAAARIGDRSASDNVAAMTLVVQLFIMVAPLTIGAIAEAQSLRLAFAMLLPLLLIGLWAARALDR